MYKWNEPVKILFSRGENFIPGIQDGPRSKTRKLELYFDGAKDDLSSSFPGGNDQFIRFRLLDEGTAMVTYQSGRFYTEGDSAGFRALLSAYSDSIADPEKHIESKNASHFFFLESAKTIFQVEKTNTNTFKLGTSLPLDIIPQQNPYQLKNSDSLEVRILFHDEPLINNRVTVWQKTESQNNRADFITDNSGQIKFPVVTLGTWLVSISKPERWDENGKPDSTLVGCWRFYRGTCTWGYNP